MSERPPLRKAGFLQLAFLIYGAACAGAFGLEDMIGACGPGIALLTLLVMPFLFSIPLSLAVSELTTTFPVEGGNYRWSRMAFGDFWGFQSGWWAWMSGMFTNSVFAVLFADYFSGADWLGGAFIKSHPAAHWGVAVALVWLVYALNLRGIDVVGNAAVVLSVLLLVPFAIMCVIGAFHWNTNPFVPFVGVTDKGIVGFSGALAVAIWLYSGYEKLSPVAEEVENPQKVFPPALFFAATLCLLSYLLPTIFALAELGRWQDWVGAYFPKAAELMGGLWLGRAMTIGGLMSNALLLNVTMLSASRIPLALSNDRLLPRSLARTHARFGTPYVSLLFGSLTVSVLSLKDFTSLATIYSWFQMLSNIMIYANVMAMRRSHPDAERPFRMPGGAVGLWAATLPTCVLAVVGMGTTLFDKSGHFDPTQLWLAAAALLSGPAAFAIIRKLGVTRRKDD